MLVSHPNPWEECACKASAITFFFLMKGLSVRKRFQNLNISCRLISAIKLSLEIFPGFRHSWAKCECKAIAELRSCWSCPARSSSQLLASATEGVFSTDLESASPSLSLHLSIPSWTYRSGRHHDVVIPCSSHSLQGIHREELISRSFSLPHLLDECLYALFGCNTEKARALQCNHSVFLQNSNIFYLENFVQVLHLVLVWCYI